MPLVLAAIGNMLFVAALGIIKFFARHATINTAIVVGLTALSSVAVAALIAALNSSIAPYISALSNIPAVPYFLPSNLKSALIVIVGTKVSVTGYVMYIRWVTNRAYIFKA